MRTANETRELATLLDVARAVASTLELEPLLSIVLDQLKLVADYAGASIGVIEGDRFRFLESRGATATEREPEMVGVTLPIAADLLAMLRRHEPLIIADVRGDDELARGYRHAVGDYIDSPAMRYVRAFLGVPLVHRDRLIGLLTLSGAEPGAFTARHARLATAIAAHAAAAIENARLYEEARAAEADLAQQLERLEALTGITQRLLAATELDAVLEVVVESAVRLAGIAGAAVGLLENEGRTIDFAATAGQPRGYRDRFGPATVDEAFLAGTAVGQALVRRETLAIEDYTAWGDAAGRHHLHAAAVGLDLRAVIVAPLLVDGAPIGILRVHDTAPRGFAPEDVSLVQALADQAALAIEHARLLRRGQEAAVLEERARLARDLHDSVTQSIFSLSMLTQAARQQHERAPQRVGPTIERIGALAQESLIEMRSLLFELQPAALAEQGLATALERLAGAMRVRGDLRLTFHADTDARPPAPVELAMFRIGQEALANVIKHARAAEVSVTLAEDAGRLLLTVADRGAGFDPEAAVSTGAGGSGGMGLRSMRERAAAAGIDLRVCSTPGAGTTVTASAPLQAGD